MILKILYFIIDLLLFGLRAADQIISPLRVSKTGFDNPRVRNMVGMFGYWMHAYRLSLPNIYKWRKDKGDLFPAVLQVQTINRCNAACGFCPYPYTVHLQERRVMDDALFSKIVDECASADELSDFVPMSKNEPLLDVKMEKRVAEFKAKARPHQMVELVTNGSALTPTRAQSLMDAGVDLLTVSINASNEKTYQDVMIGLSWPQVMRNLESLSQMSLAKINVYLRFVSEQKNRKELALFRKRWGHFNLFAFDINNRAGTVRDYKSMVPQYGDFAIKLKRIVGSRVYPICPYIFSMAHVLENGDMPMCSNDWHNREVLGNVRQQSIREIYNSPRMKALRALMQAGRFEEIEACRDCSFYFEWMKKP